MDIFNKEILCETENEIEELIEICLNTNFLEKQIKYSHFNSLHNFLSKINPNNFSCDNNVKANIIKLVGYELFSNLEFKYPELFIICK